MKKIIQSIFLLCMLLLLAACETTSSREGIQAARSTMNDNIRTEPAGNYYVARRYYKQDYKFWGYVRSPGQPWSTAKLVMLNEQKKLAPDREKNDIGCDNNYEYKLYGKFSGETVYEPASNGFYPEFVLTGYEVITTTPAPIFRFSSATDPAMRVIADPY
ncbi:MAG: hypothetical protein WCH43_00210 [Verrucomicrobiota bacterium]